MKILVLDFDGVICDSADETARAGWLAGSFIWPEWAKHDITPGFLQKFRKLRPLLHTGFEAIAILKMIEDDYSIPFIKSNYHFLMRQIFTSSQYNFDELKAFMSRVRDDWIRINEKDWLSRQRLFPVMDEFIPAARQYYDHVFILTTREGKYAARLLENSGIDFDRDHILGLETGKDKNDSLDELLELYLPELRIEVSEEEGLNNEAAASSPGEKDDSDSVIYEASADEIIFIDDRYLTLEKIIKDRRLENIRLFMPCWGYNLPEERYAADSEQRINLLETEDLYTLLE